MKKLLVSIICLIAVILFTFLGFKNIKDGKNFIKTTATITDIRQSSTSADDSDYDVEVKFSVDGKEYTTLLGEYNAAMKVGKKIDIKYNPNNPNKVILAGNTTTIILFVMAGVSLIALIASVMKFLRG